MDGIRKLPAELLTEGGGVGTATVAAVPANVAGISEDTAADVDSAPSRYRSDPDPPAS